MSVEEQYQQVAAELRACVEECGCATDEVLLIAVSKTVDAATAARAHAAGAQDFGENRPDCLLDKAPQIPDANWHFIGNIQSRRIHDIVPYASLIHSVYKASHLPKIDAAAQAAGKVQDILIEVNVSGEASKSGVDPSEAQVVVQEAQAFDHIRVRGLMTMAPQGDEGYAYECFCTLAQLADDIRATLDEGAARDFNELSMGMSEDWRAAVRAGATMVRIGRAIFAEDFSE